MAILAASALLTVAALSALPPLPAILVALACSVAAFAPATPLALLVIMLTLSPLRALIATETAYAFPLDIGQLLLLLYLAFWLTERMRARKPIFVLRTSLPLSGALCLTLVFALGAWQAASTAHWLREWLKWLVIALVIWSMTLAFARHWRWLVFAFLVSATANAIVGIYIFLGGSGADHLVILGGFYRAFGTFGQPNPFGGFMGIALPIALMTAVSQLRALWRVWRSRRLLPRGAILSLAACAFACLLIAAALLASWSRGAWLGIAMAALVMFIALPRRLWHGLALTLAVILLFALAWSLGILPDSILNRLTTAASDLVTVTDARGVSIYPWNYAVIERLAHWQAALNMADEAPLLGLGLGSYEVLYDQYRLINWEDALGHAHNHYLNTLAETGLLGLAAYLAFWLLIIRATWRLRRHPDSSARFTAVGLLGCWCYIAAHSLFDNLFVNNLFLHIGVLLGILAILQRQLTQALKLE